MRVACVYHPRLHQGCGKFHFIADAFRAQGHDVTHVQTVPELRAADERCDLVLFEQREPASLNFADLMEWVARDGHKSVWMQWMFDVAVFDESLPIESQPGIEPYIDLMRVMDAVLVKEKSLLGQYRDCGINALWFDQACPSTMRQAVLTDNPSFDVVLWGSSRRPLWRTRWNDVETLASFGFKVAWASHEGIVPKGVTRLPGCEPLELPGIIEQGKVSLCVDARQDLDGYWSDRIWLAAGAGACVVRRKSLGDEHLPDLNYRSEAELVETVKYFCRDFESRRSQAHFARDLTMAQHTYESRVTELVKHAEVLRHERHEDQNLPALQGA